MFANLRGHDPTGAAVPPAEVLDGFLRALGVPPALIPPRVEEREALFRTHLNNRRMLIVLDNAETSEQVRWLLPGAVGCLVVVTSRSELSGLVVRSGAQRIPVGLLSESDALALLRQVMGPDRVDAEPAAALELTRLCAYLPLALRLAAERADRRPHLTLADLTRELADEYDRLDLLAAEDDETTAVRAGSIGEWAAPLSAGAAWFEAQRLVAQAGWRNENSVQNLSGLAQVVNAYEAVNAEFDIAGLRWMVHHVPFVTNELLTRLQALGCGVQMAAYRWVTSGPTDSGIGAPFRTIMDHGVQVGMHGDGVHIAPLNPWPHIYYATTGLNSFGSRSTLVSSSPATRRCDCSLAATAGSCRWRTRSARSRRASSPTSSSSTGTTSAFPTRTSRESDRFSPLSTATSSTTPTRLGDVMADLSRRDLLRTGTVLGTDLSA